MIAMAERLSIIIPTLNEEAAMAGALAPLQPWRRAGHEVIVVDGGSEDATVQQARPQADHVLITNPGRAHQMNAGAEMATGSILLFLHADTHLPEAAPALIANALEGGRLWGRFDVRLSGGARLLRVVAWMMNRRSRLSGIATGDQAIFLYRNAFRRVGGFPDIPLMEDIALSRALKRLGRPACLAGPAITSSRRWDRFGVGRTILLMWWLRLAYFFGADPRRLAALYRTSGNAG
jgi:rSAM/selenodomain-associated transferase 2